MIKLMLACLAWMTISGKMRGDKSKQNIADEIMNRKRKRW